jgi:hypothetical protein
VNLSAADDDTCSAAGQQNMQAAYATPAVASSAIAIRASFMTYLSGLHYHADGVEEQVRI